MFEWLKRRRLLPVDVDRSLTAEPKTPARPKIGKYALLYDYLEHRYADSVVLTFAQIEDLVGGALPEEARVRPEWWTDVAAPQGAPTHADAWRQASRTAVPNLSAEIVTFDRAS